MPRPEAGPWRASSRNVQAGEAEQRDRAGDEGGKGVGCWGTGRPLLVLRLYKYSGERCHIKCQVEPVSSLFHQHRGKKRKGERKKREKEKKGREGRKGGV